MTAHTCNPSTWEVEAGGSRTQGQPDIRSETVSPCPPKQHPPKKPNSKIYSIQQKGWGWIQCYVHRRTS
jgi:hypothetical protein